MANVLFITAEYLKENSVIESNTEEKLLVVKILQAQEIEIVSTIGSGLYNELKTKVVAGTITGKYLTLMEDYIQPCLVEWTLWRLTPYMTNKFENSSIVQKNGENSISIDMNKEIYLRKEIKQVAEVYSERLKNYLCENESTFPLFQNPGSGRDVIQPNKNNYSCGMFLEDLPSKGYSELDHTDN